MWQTQEKFVVQTVLQRMVMYRSKDSNPVKASRQRSAFPPNYVHSLDSTHMMMTALACRDDGPPLSIPLALTQPQHSPL